MKIDLNADLGEGSANDEALLQIVSSANIACGFHAGDAVTMHNAVRWAIKYGVAIGAHPGFPDRENFGRIAMDLPLTTIYSQILYQLGALDAIVRSEGGVMRHVKPHGMLYNQAAKDSQLASAIAQAVKDFNPSLFLVGLSGSKLISEAEKIGLKTINEVFADRRYQSDGALVPRNQVNAIIDCEEDALQQTLNMVKQQRVLSIDLCSISVKAETVCLHGDSQHALAFAKLLRSQFEQHGITITAE